MHGARGASWMWIWALRSGIFHRTHRQLHGWALQIRQSYREEYNSFSNEIEIAPGPFLLPPKRQQRTTCARLATHVCKPNARAHHIIAHSCPIRMRHEVLVRPERAHTENNKNKNTIDGVAQKKITTQLKIQMAALVAIAWTILHFIQAEKNAQNKFTNFATKR